MTTLNLQVEATGDNWEYASVCDRFSTSWLRMDLSPHWLVGFRFVGVGVPNGATIDAAYGQVHCRESCAATLFAYVDGNDIDDAVAPTTCAGANALDLTSAQSGTWICDYWNACTWYDTPSIASVIQEIVDRPGWASGNAMIILGNPDEYAASTHMTPYSVDSSRAPKLTIDYTVGGEVVEGAAAISGTGALIASALLIVPAVAGISGAGALAASALAIVPAAAALSGAGSLSATGTRVIDGVAALSGVGSLTADGLALVPAAAALSGTGTASGSALIIVPAALVLAGVGDSVAAALVLVPAAVVLTGIGALTADGMIPGLAVEGAAVLAASGALWASGGLYIAPGTWGRGWGWSIALWEMWPAESPKPSGYVRKAGGGALWDMW